MISVNYISHICFLLSLLFFVVSGVVFFTMDVRKGWEVLQGRPVKYTKEQKMREKHRRKELNQRAAKMTQASTTAELTKKIATDELVRVESEATTILSQAVESEATTILSQAVESEATTILSQETESEATTILQPQGQTTVLYEEKRVESDFRIIFEITQCSVSEEKLLDKGERKN